MSYIACPFNYTIQLSPLQNRSYFWSPYLTRLSIFWKMHFTLWLKYCRQLIKYL